MFPFVFLVFKNVTHVFLTFIMFLSFAATETAQQLKKSSGITSHAKGRGLVKKLDTTTPLRGIPKQVPFRSPVTPPGFSSPGARNPLTPRTPLRKERGVKVCFCCLPSPPWFLLSFFNPDVSRDTLAVHNKMPCNETLVLTIYFCYYNCLCCQYLISFIMSFCSAASANTIRDSLQSPRLPDEPPTSAATSQFKQRAPLFSGSLSSPGTPTGATTPTPGTPVTPQPTTPMQQSPVQLQAQPKKSLSLTKEQMYAAQEMFKTANKVTRPEKALILGFMAGSRENPCPDQGDIIQIKLSEHTEVLPKADGTGSTTMLVDTVFEMNYGTGQWTRLKKYKPITNTS
uniref:HDAg domain-containing protein n=1 Tax=Eptatretus burgeri TaxID=7764 RepID=A0A8C4WXL8_EPTBU